MTIALGIVIAFAIIFLFLWLVRFLIIVFLLPKCLRCRGILTACWNMSGTKYWMCGDCYHTEFDSDRQERLHPKS